jgi:hypothetical protein
LYAHALLHESDGGVIKLPELQDEYKSLQNKVHELNDNYVDKREKPYSDSTSNK